MTKRKLSAEQQARLDEKAKEIIGVPATIKPQRIQTIPIDWPDQTEKGAPKPTFTNASVALQEMERSFGLKCSLDVFNNRYIINGKGVAGLTDSDLTDPVVRVLRELSRMHFGLDPGKEQMGEALQRAKGSP